MTDVIAGRFALCDPIARGGSGVVWRAYDRKRQQFCAAKVLRRRDAGDLLRFVREQSVRMSHQHVLTPYSWAAEDAHVVIASELVDGGSVSTLISDYGPLAEGIRVTAPTRSHAAGRSFARLRRGVHDGGTAVLIGVIRETKPGETRVAATPKTVEQLRGLGYDVLVESGAGTLSSFADDAFAAAGATIGPTEDVWGADIVFGVNAPDERELARLRDGATFIGMLNPRFDSGLVERLGGRHITALSMDAVPRISRAQSLDVLSSMANIAGYRAVVEAAHVFGRFFTGQVTAAGKVPPAKVLVAGAGVAGLAAIGAASSMGAIVRATDPRPEVADQVKSLGGEFLSVDVEQEASTDGYAKATSEDYDRRAAEIYSEQAADVDIIVTTALIPGRPAPKLITEADVAAMKPGSVVVDMAAAQGGNVAGSRAGEVVVTDNQVTIIGYTDLAGRLPAQASQLYGTNLVNLMKLVTPEKDGQLVLDMDDVVQRGITVVKDGETMWPPPPVQVSAAPTAPAAPPAEAPPPKQPASTARKLTLIGIGVLALFLVNAFAPAPLPEHFTVLVLAVVVGYYVIGKVHHALHTPLMSVTNAISGIIVVGAMLQIREDDTIIRVLAFVAILLASINVFGGFAVTRRMLGMFSK